MSDDSCSFCKKPREEVRGSTLIRSAISGAAICADCCTWAAGPTATVAACAGCEPVDGKHDALCPELAEAS